MAARTVLSDAQRRQLRELFRKHLLKRAQQDLLIQALEDVRNDYEKAKTKRDQPKQRRPSRAFRRRIRQLQSILLKVRKLLREESVTSRDVANWLNISLAGLAEAFERATALTKAFAMATELGEFRPQGPAKPASVEEVDELLAWVLNALALADSEFPRRGRPADEASRHFKFMVEFNLRYHLRHTDSRMLARLRESVIRVLTQK